MANNRRAQRSRQAPDLSNYVTREELETEIASRLVDPFESSYLGVLRTNDPLLLERGQGGIEIYRDLKRDGKVFSSLQKRQLALVGYDWTVTPITSSTKADEDAKTMHDILDSCGFDNLCKQLMDALLTGIEVVETMWTVSDGMWVPKRFAQRAQKRFTFIQDTAERPPELRMLTREDMLRGRALPERKFIVHRVNPQDDNPYGMGLGLQTYWPVFFKRAGIVAWNKRLARTGSPMPWGKYPNGAGPKEKDTLFRALRAMSNDGVLMTPQGMDISLLESKMAGSGSISSERELAEYMDDWIAAVWTGESPRGKAGGAVAAAAKERESVRLGLTKGDSDLLTETLKEQLLDHICYFNGLEPCKVYRQIKADEDTKAQSETDKNVADLGFEPSEAYIKERYGDGWTKKQSVAASDPAAPNVSPVGPSFAEASGVQGQDAIDQALASIGDAELQDAMRGLLEPLFEAIEATDNFEDALAVVQQAFPKMDSAKLQSLVASAIFGGQAYGRAVEA